MSIQVRCVCGRNLRARDEFAGSRAECPFCGRMLDVPAQQDHPLPGGTSASGVVDETGGTAAIPQTGPGVKVPVPSSTSTEAAVEISEFFDPPQRPPQPQRRRSVEEHLGFSSHAANPVPPPDVVNDAPAADPAPQTSLPAMIQALLDPRSIHWMLMFGGGLCVLGLIIYLTSLGIFKDKLVLAVCLAAGTLALFAGGWFVGLRTKHRVAGEALTFLACVVAPLNLWFLHAQGLVPLERHLWLGGVICSILYIATLLAFRVPLFMYAVEAGVTLTVGLFLYTLGMTVDSSHLVVALVILGAISIHAERAFAPATVGGTEFDRQRFGLPVFWSGHVQLGLGLLILLGTQLYPTWLKLMAPGFPWPGNLLTERWILSAFLWLAGAYLYLYSDLIVRKIGVYLYAAAFCLLCAGVTAGVNLDVEVLIMLFAVVAFLANHTPRLATGDNRTLIRTTAPLAMLLSFVPVVIGAILHTRATSQLTVELNYFYPTTWIFVLAMVVTAISNRASAWLTRDNPRESSVYILLCAVSLIVAAAGLLRMLGILLWAQQAPILMLIPLLYLGAAWLWRGQSPEEPVGVAAHAGTAAILLGVLVSALDDTVNARVSAGHLHLLAMAVFAEATLFYGLAARIRRRSANIYFAAAAACLMLWQGFEHLGIPSAWFTMLYSAAGVGMLVLAHSMGLEEKQVYRRDGQPVRSLKGPGLELFQCASGVLLIALLAAFFQGLIGLIGKDGVHVGSTHTFALILTAIAGGIGAFLSPPAGWRRAHAVGAVSVGAVAFLTLVLRINLNPWQKLEVFLLVVGAVMLITACVARFRERGEDDLVSTGLWFGSFLLTFPLLAAVVAHRGWGTGVSLPDELGLITICAALLLTGVSWQIKGSTVCAGITFVLYVAILLISLGWHAQLAVGAYLAIGGGAIFLVGLLLSVFRDKLVALPERMAKREGVFKVLSWR